jgi:hypothetical protein
MNRRGGAALWALVVMAGLAACGPGMMGPDSMPTPEALPPVPVAVTPAAGASVTADRPTFTVRNAMGYDQGAATYTFELANASGAMVIATVSAPAGRGTTSAAFTDPLPRGLVLSWRAVARSAAGSEVASARLTFRPPGVDCVAGRDPYAKRVIDLFLTNCSRRRNSYNDPGEVLGPPDAARISSDPFVGTGFLSLGEKGHVDVDMEVCATDTPGGDIRVWQTVSNEPVTLYVAGRPEGPYLLIGDRVRCGTRLGGGPFSGYCDFDLADGEIQEARYLRVEDGEHFPCQEADTDTEGADIDAVQVLHLKP